MKMTQKMVVLLFLLGAIASLSQNIRTSQYAARRGQGRILVESVNDEKMEETTAPTYAPLKQQGDSSEKLEETAAPADAPLKVQGDSEEKLEETAAPTDAPLKVQGDSEEKLEETAAPTYAPLKVQGDSAEKLEETAAPTEAPLKVQGDSAEKLEETAAPTEAPLKVQGDSAEKLEETAAPTEAPLKVQGDSAEMLEETAAPTDAPLKVQEVAETKKGGMNNDNSELAEFNLRQQNPNQVPEDDVVIFETAAPNFSTKEQVPEDDVVISETAAPSFSTKAQVPEDDVVIIETAAPSFSTEKQVPEDDVVIFETAAPSFSTRKQVPEDDVEIFETAAPSFSTKEQVPKDDVVIFETAAPSFSTQAQVSEDDVVIIETAAPSFSTKEQVDGEKVSNDHAAAAINDENKVVMAEKETPETTEENEQASSQNSILDALKKAAVEKAPVLAEVKTEVDVRAPEETAGSADKASLHPNKSKKVVTPRDVDSAKSMVQSLLGNVPPTDNIGSLHRHNSGASGDLPEPDEFNSNSVQTPTTTDKQAEPNVASESSPEDDLIEKQTYVQASTAEKQENQPDNGREIEPVELEKTVFAAPSGDATLSNSPDEASLPTSAHVNESGTTETEKAIESESQAEVEAQTDISELQNFEEVDNDDDASLEAVMFQFAKRDSNLQTCEADKQQCILSFKTDLATWSVEKLTKFLKSQGLATSGQKEEMVDRIVSRLPFEKLLDMLNQPMGQKGAPITMETDLNKKEPPSIPIAVTVTAEVPETDLNKKEPPSIPIAVTVTAETNDKPMLKEINQNMEPAIEQPIQENRYYASGPAINAAPRQPELLQQVQSRPNLEAPPLTLEPEQVQSRQNIEVPAVQSQQNEEALPRTQEPEQVIGRPSLHEPVTLQVEQAVLGHLIEDIEKSMNSDAHKSIAEESKIQEVVVTENTQEVVNNDAPAPETIPAESNNQEVVIPENSGNSEVPKPGTFPEASNEQEIGTTEVVENSVNSEAPQAETFSEASSNQEVLSEASSNQETIITATTESSISSEEPVIETMPEEPKIQETVITETTESSISSEEPVIETMPEEPKIQEVAITESTENSLNKEAPVLEESKIEEEGTEMLRSEDFDNHNPDFMPSPEDFEIEEQLPLPKIDEVLPAEDPLFPPKSAKPSFFTRVKNFFSSLLGSKSTTAELIEVPARTVGKIDAVSSDKSVINSIFGFSMAGIFVAILVLFSAVGGTKSSKKLIAIFLCSGEMHNVEDDDVYYGEEILRDGDLPETYGSVTSV